MGNPMEFPIRSEVDDVQRIAAMPAMLNAVCRTTGMGFAAIARVTEDRWIACGVHDEIHFGLRPGGELPLTTTICDEIREHHQAVVINNVDDDPVFRSHRTPEFYGFRSYISVPITMPQGTFFGTLCAIDPKPNQLDTPKITGMFKLFAELIAFHLDAISRLDEAIEHFAPRSTTFPKAPVDLIADHLLLARAIAVAPEYHALRRAIELGLYLTGRDYRKQ